MARSLTPILETERLIIRGWRDDDVKPFAALNANAEVMEYFPSVVTLEETSAMVKVLRERQDQNGFTFWPAEFKETGQFIGFIGLNAPIWEAHFTPCVEIGWRLDRPFWGKGYATEGARGVLNYGFKTLNLPEILSFTAVENMRSRHVMEKIGMTHDAAGDFDHPKVPKGHRLERHVLYRLPRRAWTA